MGIESNSVAFLLAVRGVGVDYTSTATIARQSVNFGINSLRQCVAAAGVSRTEQELELAANSGDGYAEPFFRFLGAKTVDSFDVSAYEKATHIADMNTPIPTQFRARYTAVIDGGSIEHVFNYPQALQNCMEMVAVGGHLLLMTPCNNLCGHGFYQFSPELFYAALSPENGFTVERMYIAEAVPGSRWLRVPDPAKLRRRVEYRSNFPAYLFVAAKRVSAVPVFAKPPQQSDYVVHWETGAGDHSRRSAPSQLRTTLGALPSPAKRLITKVASRLSQIRHGRNRLLKPVDLFADAVSR